MKLSSLMSYLLLILLSISCKNENKSSTDSTVSKIEVIADEEKQTHQIFLLTVDNLRVREGAEKASKVVDKLAEGSIVYGDGTISDHTEEVVLRNRKYNSSYHKITYNVNTGWVYGGGLYKIYDESESPSFTDALESTITQIGSPKKQLLDKGKQIMATLRNENSGSQEWNDIIYLVAEYYLNQLSSDEGFYKELESRKWTTEEWQSASARNYNMTVNPFASQYAAAGLKFTSSEGMVYLIHDPVTTKKAIGGPFSPKMESYLAIKTIESNNRFFSDAGISSPLADIVDYTLMIERFINQYPNFPRNESLLQELEYLHSAILHGTDNSPSRSFDTKELNPEWPVAWDRYLKKMPHGMITENIKILKVKNKTN